MTPPMELEQEISAALHELYGAAHRDAVVEKVVINRRRRGRPIGENLVQDIYSTFDRFCADESDPEGAPFHLPFGPGSYRWALRGVKGR